MDTRLAAVEQGLQRLQSDSVPGLMEIEPAGFVLMLGPKFMPLLTAECVIRPLLPVKLTCISEYNSRARRHNETFRRGNDALMPLRTANNTLAVGFPFTLGHLVSLGLNCSPQIARSFLTFPIDGNVGLHLKKAFNLLDEVFSLVTFIGVDTESTGLHGIYSAPEIFAEVRMDKRANRERDVAAAGPVTASTKKAAV